MQELWLKDNQLIEKEEWVKLIDNLDLELIKDKEEAKKRIKELFISAVEKRLVNEKIGVLFSGGVDSSFIAAVSKNFICYSVGFQEDTKEPEDIVEAKKVASKLGFELKYKIYNLVEAEEIVKETVQILRKVGKDDVVNVGVGCVVLAAVKLAEEKYFLSGLGSEEIFAGYERHSNVEDVNKECLSGLKQMWERDLVRDFTLAKEFGITVGTPFLDKDLIEYAMKLPGEWKLNDGKKKVILREVAEEFLNEFAWRKKKAAQYGSCFDKAISKLARKNGFKMKKDWLDSL